jgi:hypothetical protein
MPSFYCVKFGLVIAGLIMVGIISVFSLICALSSLGIKHRKENTVHQNS